MNDWLLAALLVLVGGVALTFALYPLRRKKGLLVVIGMLLAALVTYIYWRFGAWLPLHQHWQAEAKHQQVVRFLSSVKGTQGLIHQLKSKIKEQPQEPKGWYLLGRLYANEGQWQQAQQAFKKAYTLNSADENTALNYAASLWEANHRQFNDKIRSLFLQVLDNHPQQADALAMVAMDAFQGKEYAKAVNYWQALLHQLPQDSPEARTVQQAIVKAQQLTS